MNPYSRRLFSIKMKANSKAPIILWFKNDLRVHDNNLIAAVCRSESPVLPIYVFDIRLLQTTKYGFNRIGKYRMKFLYESLMDTKRAMRAIGSDLLLLLGEPETLIPTIAEELGAVAVVCSEEFAYDERLILSQTAHKLPATCRLERCAVNSIIKPNHLPFEISALPLIFTDFRRAVESRITLLQPIPAPTSFPSLPENYRDLASLSRTEFDPKLPLTEHDSRVAIEFKGGEQAALTRLVDYFWNTQCLASYKQTRNNLIGPDYSSKFSPWLAVGAISPSMILSEIKRFENEVIENESTYWLFLELLWREFFQLNALKYGRQFFLRSGIRKRARETNYLHHEYTEWREGKTKEVFVNANMKELAHTGWMSNRGRQIAASYLIHNIGCDWLAGAAWFEHLLIDYDPCSNYGNWMYIAGCGNDPRTLRVFDVAKQQAAYDPDGKFITLWNT